MRNFIFLALAVLAQGADISYDYDRLCKKGDSKSCNYLGALYADGNDVRHNYEHARDYYLKSCILKNPLGCYSLALLYEKGTKIKKNKKSAAQYYGLACDYGMSYACKKFKKLRK